MVEIPKNRDNEDRTNEDVTLVHKHQHSEKGEVEILKDIW